MCDAIDETKKRDKTLQEIIERGKSEPSIEADLAEFFRDYVKTNQFKQSTYDSTFKAYPKVNVSFVDEMNYWFAMARIKREDDEARDGLKEQFAKRSLLSLKSTPWIGVLRHLLLEKLGEKPVYFLELARNKAWVRTPSGVEKRKQILARLRKEQDERSKKIREGSWKPELTKKQFDKSNERLRALEARQAEAAKRTAKEKQTE